MIKFFLKLIALDKVSLLRMQEVQSGGLHESEEEQEAELEASVHDNGVISCHGVLIF